jgi:mannose/cellobiose epimerase-like protein (N-acyl-D-glucosamine 2-epimerase family)
MQAAVRQAIKGWLFDQALPFWGSVGMDPVNGGPVEALALDGCTPAPGGFKRVRVVARQLYVFSHAALVGDADAGRVSDALFAYLRRIPGASDGAWPRRLAVSGEVLDATPDLYDYAFVLFALGWRFRLTGDREALHLAERTADTLEACFRHPAGGFHNQVPATLPRQQNPHMHLIEASLVLGEAARSARFLALANEIADLFRRRFLQMPAGVLPEFYADDLRVTPDDQGRWIEPGHQFEWAWILAQHQKLTGTANRDMVEALVGWAERFGVDQPSQVTFNGVRDDGVPLDRASRTWPNTERIKGWLALHELTGADPWPAVEGSARLLLERYLAVTPPGCWIDAFDAAGAPMAANIPASTFYHVCLAFCEVLRLSPPPGGAAATGDRQHA